MVNVLLNHNNTMLACITKEKQVYWNQFNSSLEHLVKRHYNVSNLPKAHYIDGVPLLILVIESLTSLLEVYLFCSLWTRHRRGAMASACARWNAPQSFP